MKEELIRILCTEVMKGSKPLVSYSLQIRFKSEISGVLSEFPEVRFIFEPLADGWEALYLSKDERVFDLLSKITKPISVVEHALLGFLFGYSLDAILTFYTNRRQNEI